MDALVLENFILEKTEQAPLPQDESWRKEFPAVFPPPWAFPAERLPRRRLAPPPHPPQPEG